MTEDDKKKYHFDKRGNVVTSKNINGRKKATHSLNDLKKMGYAK